MALTYPLQLPTPSNGQGIGSIMFDYIDIVSVDPSMFTGEQEVQEWDGKFRRAEVEYRDLNQEAYQEVFAKLAATYGATGTFLLGDPLRAAPRGSVAGTPIVNGTNAAGSKTLAVKGFTPTQTDVLKAGDTFHVGSSTTQYLYEVVDADIDSDGSGNATVQIWPTLRVALSDGAAITTTNAQGVFRRIGPLRTGRAPGDLFSISFTAVEAI